MTTKPKPPVTPLGKISTVKVASIKPYSRNPRRIPAKAVEQTAKSIAEFGWQQPIVVDKGMTIVAGHTRYAAAKHLGLAEVPVVVAEALTEEQVRAFRVADNRAHDYSAWDYSALVEELSGLGEDFADVLDIADWSSLMAAFEEASNDPDAQGATPGAYDLPEGSAAMPGTGAFAVRVEFVSKEDAERAGPELMKIAGVLNVRHPNG